MQATVAHLMHHVTDPSDWKDDFTILRNLDASLRCDLCFDIYTSPVSIKSCHHTFCSTCIRTHINQSGNTGSFCPKCRQTKAYDSELIPQPVLEITAWEWNKARSFLARLQSEHDKPNSNFNSAKRPQPEQNGNYASETASGSSTPRRSKRIKVDVRSSLAETPAGSRSSPLTIDDDDEEDLIDGTDDEHDVGSSAVGPSRGRGIKDDDDDRDGEYVERAQSSRSSPSKRRHNQGAEDTTTRASDLELKAHDLVECPICSHNFTVTALNRHLDSAKCYPGFPEPPPEERGLASKPAKTTSSWFTKGGSSSNSANTDAATVSMVNEKRLVRPQYNLKTERDLRKLLEDAGLSINGDREKMVERHRQWINIWNANLDSTKARRSAPQLRKDLAAWERTKASAKDHSAHVDRQKTTWIKSNKSQFDDLIQKAKMGAMKDRKLRTELTSTASINGAGQGNNETDPHVITSSPAVQSTSSDERKRVEANGTDS